jgi:hypothetical protein
MLELLLQPVRIRHHPYLMAVVAFFSVCIATIVSWKIFPESTSLLLITFTIIPIIPIMVKLIEKEEYVLERTRKIVLHHKIIIVFVWYFIGVVLGVLFWMLFLPSPLAHAMFSEQIDAIYDFRGPSGFSTYEAAVTEQEGIYNQECDPQIVEEYGMRYCEVVDFDKDYVEEYLFYEAGERSFIVEPGKLQHNRGSYEPVGYNAYLLRHIFGNNLIILLFVLLTSFIFGAGAIFVLTWNASIVGVFIGKMIREGMAFPEIAGFFIHGVPEFISFFIAAIAGGILGVVMVRHKPKDKEFLRIIRDAVVFFGLSVVILAIAALLEVFV